MRVCRETRVKVMEEMKVRFYAMNMVSGEGEDDGENGKGAVCSFLTPSPFTHLLALSMFTDSLSKFLDSLPSPQPFFLSPNLFHTSPH